MQFCQEEVRETKRTHSQYDWWISKPSKGREKGNWREMKKLNCVNELNGSRVRWESQLQTKISMSRSLPIATTNIIKWGNEEIKLCRRIKWEDKWTKTLNCRVQCNCCPINYTCFCPRIRIFSFQCLRCSCQIWKIWFEPEFILKERHL